MKRVLKIMMVAMVVAFALPAMAQTVFDSGVETPEVQFQSTSTMTGINSQYSTSDPQLNADGTAVVPGAAPQRRPVLRTETGPINVQAGDDGNPIGDAVLPLALLAVGYALYRRHHRQKWLTRVR